ncbi:hypothetical protein F7C95_16540 [Opitutia bacterium ISCC 51]|nr:hypothetical protein F7C95_16540 [Opitutae bacterium ISCC 51]QXD27586.1 hypothetical protein GA003_16440 [Opitutae bacterium ISCC 52]
MDRSVPTDWVGFLRTGAWGMLFCMDESICRCVVSLATRAETQERGDSKERRAKGKRGKAEVGVTLLKE